MLGLQVNQRLDVADYCTDRAPRSQFVAILTHVRQHSIDVTDMEGPCPGKAQIHLLYSQGFHVVDEFQLLINLRVTSAWTLKAISQGLIVEPQLVWMVARITNNLIID